MVCWDKATILRVISINRRATDPCNLKVAIWNFSPNVTSQKWFWIWNPQRFTPWFKRWPWLNYYLSFSLFAPILRDERTEEKYQQCYFISGNMVFVNYHLKHSNLNHIQFITAIINLMVLLESPYIIFCYSGIKPPIISTISDSFKNTWHSENKAYSFLCFSTM